MQRVLILAAALALGLMPRISQAQDSAGYKIKEIKRLPATSIKSQDRAGTCWAWSAISYLETEMMRMGKDSVSLSPMYVVWNTYHEKALRYVRMHGHLNFGQGGAFADVLWAIKNYGIIPLSDYYGLQYGTNIHAHAELDGVLAAYLKVIAGNPNKQLSTAWLKGYDGILNAYLGEKPVEITYKGKKYSPMSFCKDVAGLNMDDYVSLTSFTHHPFYSKFAIEIPDNWIGEQSYNIPLEELMNVMDKAIDNGFTFAWGSDVSEEGFATKNEGIAIVPDYETLERADSEMDKWEKMPEKQKMAEFLKHPGKEKTIDQGMRQEGFDNYKTTDDHGMHVIGKAEDQFGNKYFIVKNSWGEYNTYKGYFYASYPFVAYKTINIVIHKDALSKDLKKKLGLQ
jgi:bleomycin hydrolase